MFEDVIIIPIISLLVGSINNVVIANVLLNPVGIKVVVNDLVGHLPLHGATHKPHGYEADV
jgi:hypothetical protein